MYFSFDCVSDVFLTTSLNVQLLEQDQGMYWPPIAFINPILLERDSRQVRALGYFRQCHKYIL